MCRELSSSTRMAEAKGGAAEEGGRLGRRGQKPCRRQGLGPAANHTHHFPSCLRGRRAAALSTLTATAKLNRIRSAQAWLANVLARLPDHPVKRIDELLPWSWCGSRRLAA